MIRNNKPFCDKCKREIQALTEDDALCDIEGHGWTDWKTADKHLCYGCADKLLKEANYSPCDICRTPQR